MFQSRNTHPEAPSRLQNNRLRRLNAALGTRSHLADVG